MEREETEEKEEMSIEVHKDYESIDRENLEVFNKTGLKRSSENRFRCVICGEPASIDNSMSCLVADIG